MLSTEIVAQAATPHNTIIETDLQQHIEDTRLFRVFRNGRPVQVSWNEMTDLERFYQQEAEERAAYVAMFNPCEWE